MDAAGTDGTAFQADGGAPLPLPLIAAGAAATGGAESVGGGGAFAVADGLLESPACRLLPPWAKCPPLSLFADPSCLSTPAALQFSCKLGAVPTEMVQGKSQHQDAQLDLGRVRSIVVEHAVLETFTSSRSATVDVFGVQERVADVRPPSARVLSVTAKLYHSAVDFAICPCDDDDESYTLMGSAEKILLPQYMTVSGLGREGVSCGVCDESRTRVRSVSPRSLVVPDHEQGVLTQTQEAPLPSWVLKTPLSSVRQIVLALSSVVLVRVMQFPPSHPVRPLPANAAAWTRLANATRESHYVAWGPDVLVNVGSSKLVEAMPLLDFTERGGQKFLPLNVIVFFLGRLGWVEDRSLAIDLTAGLSPATLSKFEAWAVADKRLDWSPTSETGFLQRVLALAAELAAGPLPAELKVDQDSFVPFEGHDDSAGGPDWTDSWQSRMTAFSLTQFSMLGPYADVSLLFGPMLREDVRTDPDGRPMLVAETLASWATAGSLASFATAHRRLPLLVSEALKEHVLPIQLSASITAFPAMLRDLDARFAWSDATKSASVLRYRFPCALYSLPALDGLLEGEAEATKFDTACNLLSAQLPKVTAPSLAAFTQLDRHLAAVGYDLSGDTAAERMDAMAARDERDDDLRAAAPYGGTGSGGGGAGKTALDSEPKPRMHIKTTVKLLQVWLNSPEVTGPLVYSTAPVAAAFGVAAVAGVPDEAQSGVGALIAYYHDLGDSFEVLRVALARRSVPLTQAVVFDVSTSHPIFDAISSARGDLTAYVSSKLASLDDGTLEMESDELWRASADFVVKLIEGKWSKINWHDDVLRAIEIERCKSAAPASVKERRPAVVLQPGGARRHVRRPRAVHPGLQPQRRVPLDGQQRAASHQHDAGLVSCQGPAQGARSAPNR